MKSFSKNIKKKKIFDFFFAKYNFIANKDLSQLLYGAQNIGIVFNLNVYLVLLNITK